MANMIERIEKLIKEATIEQLYIILRLAEQIIT